MSDTLECKVYGCEDAAHARGWCKPHYERWRTHGDPLAPNKRRGKAPQPKKICSIEGCDEFVNAKGMCNTHYSRQKRHGDPFAGGTSHGEPRKYLEEVVLTHKDDGDCLAWPFSRGADGYGNIRWNDSVRITSRLVCELVHGPPPSPSHEAAHSCGKGHLACVSPMHLSWKTPSENQCERVAHGTMLRGEDHPMSKLTADNVRLIRLADGSHEEIAREFNVARRTVGNIINRRSWTWLDGEAA